MIFFPLFTNDRYMNSIDPHQAGEILTTHTEKMKDTKTIPVDDICRCVLI